MILESGELDDDGLIGRKSGDGWAWLQLGDSLPRITIRFGGRAKHAVGTYSVAKLGMDPGFDGDGFRLEKLSGGTDPNDRQHDVIVSADDPTIHFCTCRGYSRHRHCKHVAAMRAVMARKLNHSFDPCEMENAA